VTAQVRLAVDGRIEGGLEALTAHSGDFTLTIERAD
jgi:hypothetical protein